MIAIFRRIRKKLADENKPVKYARYAFGEIILVVIGILIALQINNWNQSQKELNKEIQLYSEIYVDLKDESLRIEGHIEEVNKYQKLHFHIYNESKGKAQYDPDQYYNFLHWIHRYHMFFNEKYALILGTISNGNVQDRLKYYLNQERITNDAVSEWNEYKLHIVRPFLSSHDINNSEAFFSTQNPDFTALTRMEFIEHSQLKKMYGSMEFDQLFFDLRFKTSWMLQNLIWLKGSNKDFIEIIEDELILHNNTDIITHWEEIEKYIDLVNEADNFYDTKEYLKSANKYKEAFEIKEPGSGDRYAAICSFALAEDIESAFYHLFILVNGTSDYSYDDWPLRDSDLDILHHDKRWDEFTLILESNMKKQKPENNQ
jgi:hypothetical protein